MNHEQIIEALQAGDCLHVRNASEAARTGRPQQACMAERGPVAMAEAERAVQSELVCECPQSKPFDAPANWTPDGVCYVSVDEAARFAEAVKAAITKKPAHQRFNGLTEGDSLEQFEWFTIAPVRHDESEQATIQCEAGSAEFWTIYGWHKDGAEADACFVADAVHDEWNARDIVRVARQIAGETGKGFMAGDIHYGYYPRNSEGPVAVTDFKEVAEDLTHAIHEANENEIPAEDQRVDDFDNHPLAGLREAFVDYSDYSGSDQLDPYQPEATTH